MKWAGLALIVTAAAAASLVTACRKVSCLDPPEKEREETDVSKMDEDFRRMVTAASKDPGLCRSLLEPQVTLTRDALVLAGPKPRALGRRSDLATGEVQYIEPLQLSLRAYRQQWRIMYPARDFDGEITLTFDRALETPRALSVLLTAKGAGYRTMRVMAGATSFSATWWSPSPPGAGIGRIFTIEADADGTSSVELRGPDCARIGRVKTKNAEIPDVLARICKETPPYQGQIYEEGPLVLRCFDVVDIRVAAALPFGDVADLVGSVVATFPRLRVPEQKDIEVGLGLLGTRDIREASPTASQRIQYGVMTDRFRFCTLPDGGFDVSAARNAYEKTLP